MSHNYITPLTPLRLRGETLLPPLKLRGGWVGLFQGDLGGITATLLVIVINMRRYAQKSDNRTLHHKPHSWPLVWTQTRIWQNKFYFPKRPNIILRNPMKFGGRDYLPRICWIKLDFTQSLKRGKTVAYSTKSPL